MAAENNSSDRLDRIEAIIEETNRGLAQTSLITESNSRTIQAMLEARATARLEHEQRRRRIEETIQSQQELNRSLIKVQQGLSRMLASLDNDRPSILRKLN